MNADPVNTALAILTIPLVLFAGVRCLQGAGKLRSGTPQSMEGDKTVTQRLKRLARATWCALKARRTPCLTLTNSSDLYLNSAAAYPCQREPRDPGRRMHQ